MALKLDPNDMNIYESEPISDLEIFKWEMPTMKIFEGGDMPAV